MCRRHPAQTVDVDVKSRSPSERRRGPIIAKRMNGSRGFFRNESQTTEAVTISMIVNENASSRCLMKIDLDVFRSLLGK
jgi:hypothetical protein